MHLMHHDFFFFKQKTSYEMRISDWSSDVCSSDLRPVGEVRVGEVPVGEVPVGEVPVGKASSSRTPFVYHRARKLAQIAAGCSASARRDGRGIEIGRASCRERVCQFVLITVVAESFKTTNIQEKPLRYIIYA